MVDQGDIAISASYDKTMIVWDLKRLEKLISLNGTAPVVSFIWNNSLVASGERNGAVHFWDVNTGQRVYSVQNHTSAVHKLCFCVDEGSNVVASCGKDGKIAVNDIRDHNCVFDMLVHKGAVNFLAGTFGNTLVSASADSCIKIMDRNMGYSVRESITASAGILCGEIVENLFVSGCTDGNLIVYNMDTAEAMFGFGAESQGGVNCIGISESRRKVITGGDSGVPLLLSF